MSSTTIKLLVGLLIVELIKKPNNIEVYSEDNYDNLIILYLQDIYINLLLIFIRHFINRTVRYSLSSYKPQPTAVDRQSCLKQAVCSSCRFRQA